MPKKGGVLTPQERQFAAEYAAHGDRKIAAERAGYLAPDSSASRALARPAIQAEIARHQNERFTSELLPIAVDRIKQMLTDNRTPAGAAFQAAKLVIDRALGPELANKAPHEMTGEDIARALDALRAEAAKRSGKVIDVTPIEPSTGLFD